jgi:hypothetical protein
MSDIVLGAGQTKPNQSAGMIVVSKAPCPEWCERRGNRSSRAPGTRTCPMQTAYPLAPFPHSGIFGDRRKCLFASYMEYLVAVDMHGVLLCCAYVDMAGMRVGSSSAFSRSFVGKGSRGLW